MWGIVIFAYFSSRYQTPRWGACVLDIRTSTLRTCALTRELNFIVWFITWFIFIPFVKSPSVICRTSSVPLLCCSITYASRTNAYSNESSCLAYWRITRALSSHSHSVLSERFVSLYGYYHIIKTTWCALCCDSIQLVYFVKIFSKHAVLMAAKRNRANVLLLLLQFIFLPLDLRKQITSTLCAEREAEQQAPSWVLRRWR